MLWSNAHKVVGHHRGVTHIHTAAILLFCSAYCILVVVSLVRVSYLGI